MADPVSWRQMNPGILFLGRMYGCAALALFFSVTAVAETSNVEVKPAPQPDEPQIVYRLTDDADRWDPEIRKRIVESMDYAVGLYNELGVFQKKITVRYNPATPTADGNFNGHINFGGQMSPRTALHEIAHTLGVGTHRRWRQLTEDGRWTGEHALALLREFDGPDAVLNADRHHFWPYGLNYEHESSEENDRRHVLIVEALVRDMGLGPEVPVTATPESATPAAAAGEDTDS